MKTQFDTNVRVLLCDHCGAPLEVGLGAGAARCRHCGAQSVFAARVERFVIDHPRMPEAQRLAELRRQDWASPPPPPALAHLIEGGRVPSWHLDEAMRAWLAARKELRTGSVDAAERFLFLTNMMSSYLFESRDYLRLRAMYESALEAVELPRHKQVLRGFLSRTAASLGDLDAAERWLAPCDPYALELDADGAYRLSRATLATARGEWPTVLAWLGNARDEVPIHDLYDAAAVVQRANALEQLGRLDLAVAALQLEMQRGPGARDAVEALVAASPGLALCRGSLPRARAAFAEAAQAKVLGHGSARGSASAFMLALSLIFVPIIGLQFAQNRLIVALLVGTLVALVAAAMALFFRTLMASDRAQWVLREGLDARGRVLDVRVEGGLTPDLVPPSVVVELLVKLPGRAPYQAVSTAPPGTTPEQVRAMGELHLKVDPQRLDEVLIVW